MASLYEDFVANVRAWSNRDEDVLPDAVIQDAMSYTMDKAYKMLKIPVLEAELNYTIIEDDAIATSAYQVKIQDNEGISSLDTVKLPIPGDLTSFIYLRQADKGIVFNEKTDVRTFHDMYADRYTDYFWTRQGGYILAAGDFAVGDVIELHYYRRLPALDARYNINATSFNQGLITVPNTQATTGTSLFFNTNVPYPPIPGTHTAYDTQSATNSREEYKFADESGVELDNWFRDENRQVVLFGALSQCFDYLADDVNAAKYKAKFIEAIEELNQEEKMRKASGGNIQMHFNSQLI